jgi:hypothetical protein
MLGAWNLPRTFNTTFGGVNPKHEILNSKESPNFNFLNNISHKKTSLISDWFRILKIRIYLGFSA